MNLSRWFLFTAIFCLLFLTLCSPTDPGPKPDDQPTATIIGTLFKNNSKAVGAKVYIRKKTSLATIGLSKTMDATDSAITDENGQFTFDSSLDTGTYTIEAVDDSTKALIDSVIVESDSEQILPADTLKPVGTLEGTIILPGTGDIENVFVLAFGVDRFARVDSTGKFKFKDMAEAKYNLWVMSNSVNYNSFAIAEIPVAAGETTTMDTVELSYASTPAPQNIRISYDTARSVLLTWDRLDTNLIKFYSIFRRNADPDSDAVKLKTISDTFYLDTNFGLGQKYEYYIRSLDSSRNESKNSVIKSTTTSFYVFAGKNQTAYSGDTITIHGQTDLAPSGQWIFLDSITADSFTQIVYDTGTFSAIFSADTYTDTMLVTVLPRPLTKGQCNTPCPPHTNVWRAVDSANGVYNEAIEISIKMNKIIYDINGLVCLRKQYIYHGDTVTQISSILKTDGFIHPYSKYVYVPRGMPLILLDTILDSTINIERETEKVQLEPYKNMMLTSLTVIDTTTNTVDVFEYSIGIVFLEAVNYYMITPTHRVIYSATLLCESCIH